MRKTRGEPVRSHSIIISNILIVMYSMAAAHAVDPPITSLVFTPDHHSVVASSQAGLALYSWPELKLQQRIEVEMLNLHALSFSSDGKYIAIGGGNPAENGNVQVFNWPAMTFFKQLGDHADSISDVCWLGDSGILAASLDRSIKAWSLTSGSLNHGYRGHSKSITALCLLKDGKTLVSAGVDQSVRVWNVNTGGLIRSMNQHTAPINALALRPTERGLPIVASAADDRTIRFWQPTIGRMVRYVRLDSEPLDIVWLNDGDRIAASCVDGYLRIIDATEVKVLKELHGIDGWAYAIALHPVEGSLVLGGSKGQLKRFTAEEILDAN